MFNQMYANVLLYVFTAWGTLLFNCSFFPVLSLKIRVINTLSELKDDPEHLNSERLITSLGLFIMDADQ